MPVSTLFPLTAGVHLGLAPHRLPPGFSPRMSNLRIRNAQFRKRPGTRAFVDLWRNDADTADLTTAAGIITGLFEYRRETGAIDIIALTGGSTLAERRIYKHSSARWLNITDAALYDAAGSDDLVGSATQMWDATVAPNATLNDVFYASNGHTSTGAFELIKFTGSGTATAFQGGPGPARYLATFANRLILGHVFDIASGLIVGNRIAWSAFGDAETWTGGTTGSNDLIETPDNITRLLTMRGRLIVYKEHSIFLVSETGIDTVPLSFELISKDRGTPAGFSVAAAAGVHFFMGYDDVFAFDGVSLPRPIGGPIRSALSSVNPAAYNQVFALTDESTSEYWLFVPEGDETYPNAAWVYNWAENHWTRWDFPFSVSTGSRAVAGTAETWSSIDTKGTKWSEMGDVTWDEISKSGGMNQILANSDKTVEELSFAIATDAGVAIDAFWESPDVDFAGTESPRGPLTTRDLKTLSRISVRLRPGTGSVSLSCDISTDGGQTFSSATGPSTTPSGGGIINFDTWITGETFRVRLRNNTVAQQFPGAEEIVFNFIPRGPVR